MWKTPLQIINDQESKGTIAFCFKSAEKVIVTSYFLIFDNRGKTQRTIVVSPRNTKQGVKRRQNIETNNCANFIPRWSLHTCDINAGNIQPSCIYAIIKVCLHVTFFSPCPLLPPLWPIHTEQKYKRKQKIIFDVCHFFRYCFCLFFDYFCFRSRFRSVWIGP